MWSQRPLLDTREKAIVVLHACSPAQSHPYKSQAILPYKLWIKTLDILNCLQKFNSFIFLFEIKPKNSRFSDIADFSLKHQFKSRYVWLSLPKSSQNTFVCTFFLVVYFSKICLKQTKSSKLLYFHTKKAHKQRNDPVFPESQHPYVDFYCIFVALVFFGSLRSYIYTKSKKLWPLLMIFGP